MKRVLMLFICMIFLTSVISADIIINEQPKDLYNLGERIKIPIKLTTTTSLDGFLSVKLICNGIETEIYKKDVLLKTGEEETISADTTLRTGLIGRTTGTCVIKPVLGDEYIVTNEFKISDIIYVNLEYEKTDFSPKEDIIIEGSATKENEENVQGYAELSILNDNLSSELTFTDTVKNGYFYLNFSLPKNTKAGQYLTQVKVYEKGKDGNITNSGFSDVNLYINQVPKNLEIAFEEKEITPNNDSKLRVKGILHDQTGEQIESNVIIKIFNENDKLIEQTDIATNEFFEYPIEYSQPACEWKIIITSNGLENEATLKILENEDINIELINGTVILTNIGNVPYNDTVLIKIGNESVSFDAYIPVGKEEKYSLTAPDGEYDVKIISGEDNRLDKRVTLTGKAISVEESSMFGILGSFVWIFIVLVLGFVAFTVYKKGYKKTFFGRIIPQRFKKKLMDKDIAPAGSLIKTKHRAVLSLSIKGDKQNASVICLKIKNQGEILKNKKIVEEILQKIANIAEEAKASIYENQEYILFIFAPTKTKTFHNQKKAVDIAEEISNLLDKYNKVAKQKISAGISLNYGTIIAKHEKGVLNFMSMGTLITTAKRIASHSKGEVLLSKEIYDKLRSHVKAQKHEAGNLNVYSIKEIKHLDKDNKKFITRFIEKLEKENMAKKSD